MKRLLTRAAIAGLLVFVLVTSSCQSSTPPTPLVPLDRVQIFPEAVTLTPGGVRQFLAKAFDKNNNEIKDFTSKWTVAEGGGTVYENGIFVAGTEAGSYKDTVKLEATYGGASEVVAASVTVTALPAGQTLIFTPTIPAHVPGLGYLIYEDDFSSDMGWAEGSKDGKEYYLKDGAYHMIAPSWYYSVWAPEKSLSQLGDFSLEVTLSRISGPQDSKYGITFKIGDTGQRGFILISHEGQVYFWKDEGHESQETYVNSIKVFEGSITTSPGESLDKVKLGVERQGVKWKVSVNDSPVISVSDTAEPLTGIGFEVSNNLHATFDNLKVYVVALPRAPPSAPPGFMVFSDTFDGWDRGWSLPSPKNTYFEKGALHIVTDSEKFAASVNDRIPNISSFAYQAELYFKETLPQTQGSLDLRKEQGLIRFYIGPTTRQFAISYYSQEEGWNRLIGETFSGAIKGQGEMNKLLMIGRDSSLEFYVNDVFLGSFADPYPDSPLTKIGLYVVGEGSHAAFDNVVLHSLLPLKPAEFTVSGLVITPVEAEVWEEVTVAAKVTNIGEVEGNYTTTLRIDGVEVATKEITLAGETAETVTFTVLRDVGPSCDIEVDGLTKSLIIKEGVLPLLNIGDKWVHKALEEGIEYERTLEVISKDVVDGKDSYVMEYSIEPPMMGIISSVSMIINRTTMLPLRMQMSAELEGTPFIVETSYSYELPGNPPYPLELGKEWQVIETATTTTTVMDEAQTEIETTASSYKVERIEDITVPAGTFRSFVVVKYDKDGNAVSTRWMSDKVKHRIVKSIDHMTGETTEELKSYSFK